MALLELGPFAGIAPLFDSRRLPEQNAQVANNVRFDAGDVSAARGLDAVSGVTLIDGTLQSAGNVGRMFHTVSPAGDDYLFRFYGDATIRAARNPTPGDTYWRVYFTEPSNGFLYQIPQANVAERRRLGVLPPSSMPVIGVTDAITRKDVASITLESPIVVTTTEAHGFNSGDRVKLIVPAEAGTTELDSKTFPAKIFSANVTDVTTVELRDSDGETYTAFIPGQGATIERVIQSSDYESRTYVYTYANRFGEESAPSPASEVIDAVRDMDTVEVRCTFVPELLYEPVQTIRVYRLVSGVTGDAFMFCGEFAPSSANRDGATDFYIFSDTTLSLALGETLQSQTWFPPEQNIQGIVAAPNGYLVGFKNNELHFSEPYQPHAWPSEYKKAIDTNIVGIEFYGATLVVMTDGAPRVLLGTHPSSVTAIPLESDATCENSLGICSTGAGVAYPSYAGLAHASQNGVQNVTEKLFTESQWRAIYPTITAVCFHDSAIYMLTSTGTHYALGIGDHVARTLQLGAASSAYFYPGTARPLLTLVGSAVPQVLEGGDALDGEWKSRCFEFPRPINFSCGRLLADFTPTKDGAPTVPRGQVTLQLIPHDIRSNDLTGADESTSAEDGWAQVVIESTDAFRLPALEASRVWTVRMLFGGDAGRIQGLRLATSMTELRGAP